MSGPSVNDDLRIARILIGISEVHEATSARAIAALRDYPGGMGAGANELVAEVRKKVAALVLNSNPPYREVTERLSAAEYVTPPELQKILPELIAFLRSCTDVRHRSHRGCLLYGTQGTGKSELVLRLADELGARAITGTVHPEKLRSSASPRDELETIFAALQSRAENEKKIAIFFLDDAATLLTGHAATYREQTEEHSESGSAKRSSSQHKKAVIESTTVDDKGQQVIEALQSILSGSGTASYPLVFTILTTNLTNIPAPLVRDGRLQPVQLMALSLPMCKTPSFHTYVYVPLYNAFLMRMQYALEIFKATDMRLNKKVNPAYARPESELRELMKGNIDEAPSYASGEKRCAEILANSRTALKALKKFFRLPKPEAFAVNEFLINPASNSDEGIYESDLANRPILKHLNTVTASVVAGHFKTNRERFATEDEVRLQLRRVLFPILDQPPRMVF